MPRKTFPSFAFVVSSHSESFDLTDYYRPTCHEKYQRESYPPQDLMKTINYRGRDSPEYSPGNLLPDIFEDETDVEDKSDHRYAESDEDHHARHTEPTQRDKAKQMGWLWRLFFSVLLKYRGRKTQAGKNA